MHVEAGLRSFDRTMPEEINRVLTDQIADLLYTTERSARREPGARRHRRRSGIHFVGNVMIDSLLQHLRHAVPPATTLARAGIGVAVRAMPRRLRRRHAAPPVERRRSATLARAARRPARVARAACRWSCRCIRARARTSSASGCGELLDGTPRSRCCRRRVSRDAGPDAPARAGADRFRRHAGRDHRARRSVPDDAREHRAADHGRAGHQHAGRPRSRAHRRGASTTILRDGGKRGRIPELWDGQAAQRIARRSAAVARGGVARGRSREAAAHDTRRSDRRRPIVNALTIDVEDYFQVSAFASHIPRASWERLPCRVERNVDRILELLDEHGAHATFFTLGWVARALSGTGAADRRRAATSWRATATGTSARASRRATSSCGHPRAPRPCSRTSPARRCSGYRAPSFSIGRTIRGRSTARRGRLPLQLERLSDPARSLRRARCAALRARSRARACSRCRSTTVRLLHAQPAGRRRRLFSAAARTASRAGRCDRVNTVDGKPAIFYFHPWEIDPGPAAHRGISVKTRFRHYVNLDRDGAPPAPAARDFRWGRVDRVFLKDAR